MERIVAVVLCCLVFLSSNLFAPPTVEPCPDEMDYHYPDGSQSKLKEGKRFFHRNGQKFIDEFGNMWYPNGEKFRTAGTDHFFYPRGPKWGSYMTERWLQYERTLYYPADKEIKLVEHNRYLYPHPPNPFGTYFSDGNNMYYPHKDPQVTWQQLRLIKDGKIMDEHGNPTDRAQIEVSVGNDDYGNFGFLFGEAWEIGGKIETHFELDFSGLFDPSHILLDDFDHGENFLNMRLQIKTGIPGERVLIYFEGSNVKFQKLVGVIPEPIPGPVPPVPGPPIVPSQVTGVYGRADVFLQASLPPECSVAIVKSVQRALNMDFRGRGGGARRPGGG